MDGADKQYPSEKETYTYEKRSIYMERDLLKKHYLWIHEWCRQTVSF